MNEPPRKLAIVSIVLIVLGGLGIVTALSGLASLALQGRNTFSNFPGQDKRIVEMQKQMKKEISAATQEWRDYLIPLNIGIAIISVGMVIGGIFTLQLNVFGPKILNMTLLFAIPFEGMRSFVGFLFSQRMSKIVAHYMYDMMQAGVPKDKGLPPGMDGILSGAMQIFSSIAIFFSVVWLAAKIAFYIYSILYLRNPATRNLFSPKQIPRPPLLR